MDTTTPNDEVAPSRVAAVVGAGLIGQAWAIVFARAGWQVKVHDADAARLPETGRLIARQLRELEQRQLMQGAAHAAARVQLEPDLARALEGVAYVQESSPERLDVKQALFRELDALAAPQVIIASSTSSIAASLYTEDLPGRQRCLVAHPVNPPYLIPVVELCPAPWTSLDVLAQAREIMRAIGQKPVVVRKEVEGFILNRLQGALLHEAFRLFADGVASAEDIDTTVKNGLGLRWSFMGPFETIDLNAPGGLADYCARYGGLYQSIGRQQCEVPAWDEQLVDAIHRERRERLPARDLGERRLWRDEQLMQLMRHQQLNGD